MFLYGLSQVRWKHSKIYAVLWIHSRRLPPFVEMFTLSMVRSETSWSPVEAEKPTRLTLPDVECQQLPPIWDCFKNEKSFFFGFVFNNNIYQRNHRREMQSRCGANFSGWRKHKTTNHHRDLKLILFIICAPRWSNNIVFVWKCCSNNWAALIKIHFCFVDL